MMEDLYILDENLAVIGIVDAYKSCIWAPRYRELGDFEIYLRASSASLDLLRIGRYIMRTDDDMIGRIKKIVLDTSAEEGNYLTISGTDAKSFLDQRIIWGTETANGPAEAFLRSLVEKTLISPTVDARRLTDPTGRTMLKLGEVQGFAELVNEQTSYKSIGEKVRDYCLRFGWGYRFTLKDRLFSFELYKGEDRTKTVIFSDEFENLASTSYTEDHEQSGNVALVAGTGEGEARSKATVGFSAGADRYEVFVDADDLTEEITFEALKDLYPPIDAGGAGAVDVDGERIYYTLSTLEIEIIDQNQRAWFVSAYPSGSIVTVGGSEIFRISNIHVAELPTEAPEDSATVKLLPVLYSGLLTNRGKERLSEFGAVTSFAGSVIPNITFTYKKDYSLGDLVTVRNEFGITKTARIVEVIEVNDDNGYSIEPTFEYFENAEDEEEAPAGETIGFEEGTKSATEQQADKIEESLQKYLPLSGGTMTGRIVSKDPEGLGLGFSFLARRNPEEGATNSQKLGYIAEMREDTMRCVALGVGGGGVSRGLYDAPANGLVGLHDWIIYVGDETVEGDVVHIPHDLVTNNIGQTVNGSAITTTVQTSAGTDIYQMTLPAGVWIVTGYLQWSTVFPEVSQVRLRSSQGTAHEQFVRGTGTNGGGQEVVQILNLSQEETVTMAAYQSSGSSKTTSGCYLKAVRIK